jgi:diguanylate cyclase
MGDRILRFVAGILRGVEDEDTTVARYGGEEFVILFEHVPLDHVVRTVHALREDLATRHIVARETGKPVGEVTFSAGVAPLGEEGDADAMFRAADAALYEAKQAGRDRVVVKK